MSVARRWWYWGFGLFIASLLQPLPLRAASPSEALKLAWSRVEEIHRDPSLQGEARKRERLAELQRVIANHFDVTEMGKRALGVHWQRWPAQHREFVSTFSDFMSASLAEILDTYRDGKLVYVRERVDGDFSRVEARAILSGGVEVPMGYHLRFSGGEWKIYDVLVYELSLLNHYRSRFSRILGDGSFETLLRQLEEQRSESHQVAKHGRFPVVSLLLFTPVLNVPRVN